MASGKLLDQQQAGGDDLLSTPLTSKAAAAVALMATRSKQAKRDHHQLQQQTFQLERLPVIVLDRIFGLLEAEDLRSFYQVCKGWKKCLVERPKVDLRRVTLVEWIRLNKENAPKGTGTCVPFVTPCTKETPPTWRNHNTGDDGKPGGRSILSSTESSRNVSLEKGTKSSSKSRRGTELTTPTSRFFRFYEAGKKLPKGQQLFRCPECQSPVPSPMSTGSLSMSTKSSSRSRWLSGESSSISSTPHQKQMPTSLSSIAKASDSSSLISPNNTQDSGFESIEVSSQSSRSLIDLSSLTSCHFLDSTSVLETDLTSDCHPTPSRSEITLSFIATPDDTTRTYNDKFHLSQDSGTGEDLGRHGDEEEEDEVFEADQLFQVEEDLMKTPTSVKCPACSFRFCSKCQCTEHPGRSCRLIGCGGGNPKSSKDLKSVKKRTKDELRRAARL